MREFWTEADERALESAKSFDDLADVALVVLGRMRGPGQPIHQICGPLSTGGLGFAANCERFSRAIKKIQVQDNLVFDQMPFQDAMVRLIGGIECGPDGKYCLDILEVFYQRIFTSGHINKAWFLPGWETSTGAKWERNFISQQPEIEIAEYPTEWLD